MCGVDTDVQSTGKPLSAAGFVETHADGSAAATAAAVSEATTARIVGIADTKMRLEQGPAQDILSSITLAWACMEALPRILTGDRGIPLRSSGSKLPGASCYVRLRWLQCPW